MSRFKLEVEPIPSSTWGKSLANLLPKPVWDTLRREVYAKFNYQCAICGAVGVEVHCHEVWSYKGKVQTLVGFQCLCRECHNIKHWGRTIGAYHNGELTEDYIVHLRKHFCEVNGCSEEDMYQHLARVGQRFKIGSQDAYKVDFGSFSPERVVKAWKKSKGRKG